MGRKKQFNQGHSRADAMFCAGYDRPNNGRWNRVMRLLPDRKGSGAAYLDRPQVFRAALIDQCLDAGCDDIQAVQYSELAYNAMADELRAGCDADQLGDLVIFRGWHEVLTAKYVPVGQESIIADSFTNGYLNDGRVCLGVIQIDLAKLLSCLRDRMNGHIKSFAGKKYSGKEISDALHSTKFLIDEIEAAHSKR
jgi:hypothetical protein